MRRLNVNIGKTLIKKGINRKIFCIVFVVTMSLSVCSSLNTVQAISFLSSPNADPGGPYTINIGDSLTLDGTMSSDPDIQYGDSIVEYSWDLNGNGVYDCYGAHITVTWSDLMTIFAATGRTPLITNQETGLPANQIALTVKDTTGRTHTAITSLMIYARQTSLTVAVTPTSQIPGRTVSFNGELVLTDGAAPIANQKVMVYYLENDCPIPIGFGITNDQGAYSVNDWVVPVASAGFHSILAVYAGNITANYGSDQATTTFDTKIDLNVVPECIFGTLGAIGACFGAFMIIKGKGMLKHKGLP